MTRYIVAILVGLLLATIHPLVAQDSLSTQVLQLLVRDNTWTGLNTHSNFQLAAVVPVSTTRKLYTDGVNLFWNGAQVAGSGSATSPHALLGTPTHSDVVAQSPTQGSLIIASAAPLWDELLIGGAGTMLRSTGTTAAWSTDAGSLTNIPAANIVGTLPAISGVNLTNLNASNLASGTVPLARLSGITNTEISAAAAIAYSKLALAGSINLDTDTAATALPFAKGGTGLTAAVDDSVIVSTGALWQAKVIADCDAATNALNYDTTTNAFSCRTFTFGTGTVTSVALSMPAVWSVAGSPIVGAGTFTVTLATQVANTVWAGPAAAGPSAPTFRALVNADLPLSGVVGGTYLGLTVNTRGVITSQVAATFADITGTLAFNRGGTGLAAAADDTTLVSSGAAYVATTIPNCVGGALGYTQATNLFSCVAAVNTIIEKYWWDAAICNNATARLEWSTPVANPGVAACVTGANTQKGVIDFADAANLSIQKQFRLPSDHTSTIDVSITWYTTAIAGDVVWQVSTICVADLETGDPAFNVASIATDTAQPVTNQYNIATITGLTITGCAANEILYVKLQRDSAHASDTLAATARLVGVELTTRRTK